MIWCFYFSWLSAVLPALVNVAFFTLLERKILGLAQSRKGPNKVSLGGVAQPMSDAVKLFVKQMVFPTASWKAIFWISPMSALILSLSLWSFISWNGRDLGAKYGVILFLVFLSLGLYPLLLAGWSSMSAYASVGALRGVAQTISYEISMAIFLLAYLGVSASLNLSEIPDHFLQKDSGMALALPILGWLICCIAESNRTPFDFSEGESELVSGFNVEFGGGSFAMIFMAEYATILVLSVLSAIFFCGVKLTIISAGVGLSLAFFWVWLRATLPRYRYDLLMEVAWTSLLPASLGLLILYINM